MMMNSHQSAVEDPMLWNRAGFIALTRRRLLTSILTTAPALSTARPSGALSKALRIAIVGAGVGGLWTSRYLQALVPGIEITVFEPNQTYCTCFKGSEVVIGLRDLQENQFSYNGVRQRLRFVPENVIAIEEGAVFTCTGRHRFDVIVVSTGIGFREGVIEGYSNVDAERLPHAWKGIAQLRLLTQRLQSVPQGGVVVISVPKGLFRCPPAPYERATLITSHFKKTNPRAKVIIADSQTTFSKQATFSAIWEREFGYGKEGSQILRIGGDAGGSVVATVPERNAVQLENGEWIAADLVNLIPPQSAGPMHVHSGMADQSGWCPVDPLTMESKLALNVYVLGDAAEITPMPKSAFSAASQAKVCAYAIVRKYLDMDIPEPTMLNICFSFVDQARAISIVMRYRGRPDGGGLDVASTSVTSPSANNDDMKMEAVFAQRWYHDFTQQMFALL